MPCVDNPVSGKYILKPLVGGKLGLFLGFQNDALMHREGLRGINITYHFGFVESLPQNIRHDLKRKKPKHSRKSAFVGEGDMLSETRQILDNFYEPFNKNLSLLLRDNRFLSDLTLKPKPATQR